MTESSLLARLRLRREARADAAWFCEDKEFRKSYPNLNQLLFATHEAGEVRMAGRLNFFIDEGRLKVSISLPSEGLVAFTTVDHMFDVFEVLESRLAADEIEWRPDKRNGRR